MVVSIYLNSGAKHEIEVPIELSMKKELLGIVENLVAKVDLDLATNFPFL